jgi:uncharacterized membrane protein
MENQEDINVQQEDKTVAILSYITLIGWIVALVMHNGDNNTKLGAFHIKQSLGIMLIGFGVFIISIPLVFIPFLGAFINLILFLGVLALWILGLIGAVNGETKPLPVVGEQFQNMFKSIAK